jgi:peptide deformylase
MNRLSLRLHPDPSLKIRCGAVVNFDPELARLAALMGDAMIEHGGVGLAANQVGLSMRMIVVAGALMDQNHPIALVNPRLETLEGACELEEGCLSLPGLRQKVAGRARKARVVYQGLDGAWRERTVEGLAALCVQHEIDHLDGLTMLDRMSPLKASRAKAKWVKSSRSREGGSF